MNQCVDGYTRLVVTSTVTTYCTSTVCAFRVSQRAGGDENDSNDSNDVTQSRAIWLSLRAKVFRYTLCALCVPGPHGDSS
jgi:hypothetical protein